MENLLLKYLYRKRFDHSLSPISLALLAGCGGGEKTASMVEDVTPAIQNYDEENFDHSWFNDSLNRTYNNKLLLIYGILGIAVMSLLLVFCFNPQTWFPDIFPLIMFYIAWIIASFFIAFP